MMMNRELVELDFFTMEKEKRQRSTLNDIQSAISKINPQLIRQLLASANSTPVLSQPVQVSRSNPDSSLPETAPLTMFYNGKVMMFNLSNDKAEIVMRMAREATAPKCGSKTTNGMVGNFSTGELPMARKKSLQRFLAKRKARLTNSDPYKKEVGLNICG